MIWRKSLILTAILCLSVFAPTYAAEMGEEPTSETFTDAQLAENSNDTLRLPQVEEVERTETLQQTEERLLHLMPAKGVAQADEHGRILVEKFKRLAASRGVEPKRIVIVFIHKGERLPFEQEWKLLILKRAGFQIKELRHRRELTDLGPRNAKFLEIEREKFTAELIAQYDYLAKDNPQLRQLLDQAKLDAISNQGVWKSFVDGLRSFYGLQNGITFSMYWDNQTGFRRPLQNQISEMSWGAGFAAILAGITYWAGLQQAVEDPTLSPAAAALMAGVTRVFLNYIERANGAFFAQGKSLHRSRNEIRTNFSWFATSALIHSIPISLLQLAAFNCFSMDFKAVKKGIANSVVGLFAKMPFYIAIIRDQKVGSKHVQDTVGKREAEMKTMWKNWGMNGIFKTLGNSHLYGSTEGIRGWFTMAYLALGIGGFVMETGKHVLGNPRNYTAIETVPDDDDIEPFDPARKTWYQRMVKNTQKTLQWLASSVGLREEKHCHTQILFREVTEFEWEAIQEKNPRKAGLL